MVTIKSIEEKAKAYDEALSKAKDMLSYKEVRREDMESLFPELRESEDEMVEKIRKDIISYLNNRQITSIVESSATEKWLTWLEKQGENVSLPKFTFDDVLALQCCMETTKKIQEDKELYEQLQSLHDRLHDAYWLEKQGKQKIYVNDNAKEMFIKALERVEEQNNKGYKLTDCDKNSWWEDFKAYTSCIIEQKPWSEEDEYCIHQLIAFCENCMAQDACSKRCAHWLKSLKERYTWKPSDKELGAILTAIGDEKQKGSDVAKELRKIYQQLKKLRGE